MPRQAHNNANNNYGSNSAAAAMPLERPEGDPAGYGSFEELLADVNQQTKRQGYAIVKRRASNYKDGQPTRFDLVCDRGG